MGIHRVIVRNKVEMAAAVVICAEIIFIVTLLLRTTSTSLSMSLKVHGNDRNKASLSTYHVNSLNKNTELGTPKSMSTDASLTSSFKALGNGTNVVSLLRHYVNSTKTKGISKSMSSAGLDRTLDNRVYPYRDSGTYCDWNDSNRWAPFKSQDLHLLSHWYSSIDHFFSINNTQPLNLPEDDGPNLYKNYDLNRPWNFTLPDLGNEDFTYLNGKLKCFKPGTSKELNEGSDVTCVCSSSYAGKHCSVPQIVRTALSKLSRSYIITPREKPRRIILVMTFNMEHHVLMLKILQVHSAVDLFVILESNYTGHGDPRPLRLLHNLRRGYMKRFHHKIMHVYLDTFPAGGRANGWIAETYIREQLAPAVEKRVSGLRKDDLFIFLDTDETPSVNLLHFLKLHNGYPFPVGFVLQNFIYGFFWLNKNSKTVIGVTTIQMLRDIYKGNSDAIRGSKGVIQQLQKGSHPWGMFETWLIGSSDNYAGWHASWFSSPREVITKLTSAINADFPRWGDYPEKCTFDYVATLFRKGEYFDGKKQFIPICFNDIHVLQDISYLFKYKGYFTFMLQNPTAVQ